MTAPTNSLTVVALVIAGYAALVATFTLLLGYGRAAWREHFPLKVRMASSVSWLYRVPLDPDTGDALPGREMPFAVLYLSCVNLTDLPLQVTEAGFVTRQRNWDWLRRRPRRPGTPWPTLMGQLPADLPSRRRWQAHCYWDQSPVDLTAKVRAYCLLDDGRRGFSKRLRLSKPNTEGAPKKSVPELPGLL